MKLSAYEIHVQTILSLVLSVTALVIVPFLIEPNLSVTPDFHSVNILIWALIFFIFNTVYFIISKEPGLTKRFGEEYIEYKQHVPMWIPRIKPWAKQAHSNT